MTKSPDRPPIGRKVVLVGVLGASVLAGGAGMAYAADRPDRVVETGYATVVDASNRPADSGGTSGRNCLGDGETEGTGGL